MAHYALVNPTNNTVVTVITGVDENISQTDTDGTVVGGSSEAWENFYSSQSQWNGLICKRTSYNGNYRKNYAGIGYTWDAERNAFYAPRPYASWTLNEDTCRWESPTPYPSDGKDYIWNENRREWEEVVVHP
jgi:hypothetical protein